ncbi:hypothetical protein ACSBR2_026733 [Camellia fascicularis]
MRMLTSQLLLHFFTNFFDESPNSKGGGGSAKFISNFGCKLEAYIGSYSQVRAHLIGKLPANELKVYNYVQRSSDVPRSVTVSIDNMFHVRNGEEVDRTIARCLYSNGIAFNVMRSPWWADMVTTVNNAPKGYKSPNYENVRTSLLDKEPSKAIFINGHDVFSKEKNATNIADLLFKAIEFVGLSNVVQVVTNNATNCKAARAIIQHKYSHIFWSGCLAYTLNLLMKDIAKCEDPTLLFVDE